jgi:UDP-N-acetylmuramoyl-tripeptide--D-alanyl-D-alanine ligase
LAGVAGSVTAWIAASLSAAAAVLAALRWLRVSQREHYIPDSASRFALRWWGSRPLNAGLAAAGAAGLVLGSRWPAATIATAIVGAVGPLGLGIKGTSAPLAWTGRLKRLAFTTALVAAAGIALGGVLGAEAVAAAAVALGMPAAVDLASRLNRPLERRRARIFVERASRRLEEIRPRIVAITGSYGKTTTKAVVAHIAAGSFSVVASPASFNNEAGLARTVNEHLADGTEVFVAEMGTYGPGEIASLCSWIRPDVSAITAIGPVHLERFGSEEKILAAKSEILEHATSVVLPVDDTRLADLAERCRSLGKRVLTWSVVKQACKPDYDGSTLSAGGPQGGGPPRADVVVVEGKGWMRVMLGTDKLCEVSELQLRGANLACAVALCKALGVPERTIAERIPSIQGVEHRLGLSVAPSGVTVLDDTYNSNPAGCRAALDLLAAAGSPEGRKVVVTPGMVELGKRQAEENATFARQAARTATHLIVVGRTNRRSLLAGAAGTSLEVIEVGTRDQAVSWVRDNLGAGDAVLYENDLPDHYP